MNVLEGDYVYVRVERPPDHLLKVQVTRIEEDWFLGKTAPGHGSKLKLVDVVRKTHRDAPVWVLESTGEDVTYYKNKD